MPSASISQDSIILDSSHHIDAESTHDHNVSNEESTYVFPSKSIEIHYDTISLPWQVCKTELPKMQSGQSGYVGKRIDDDSGIYDFFFLVFLACFFLIAFVFAKGKKNIALMSNVLFSSKSRQSIFFETTGKDFRDKFLLILQFTIIISVLFYICLSRDVFGIPDGVIKPMLIILSFFVLIFIYFGYKWLSTWIISIIFFEKDTFEDWKETYIAMICLGGICIFIPILLLFYIPFGQIYDYSLIFLCFFISRALIIHKSFVLFFPKFSQLHYLFLYLCTQEIIPLFLLYKSLVYLFNIVEKTTLWI